MSEFFNWLLLLFNATIIYEILSATQIKAWSAIELAPIWKAV